MENKALPIVAAELVCETGSIISPLTALAEALDIFRNDHRSTLAAIEPDDRNRMVGRLRERDAFALTSNPLDDRPREELGIAGAKRVVRHWIEFLEHRAKKWTGFFASHDAAEKSHRAKKWTRFFASHDAAHQDESIGGYGSDKASDAVEPFSAKWLRFAVKNAAQQTREPNPSKKRQNSRSGFVSAHDAMAPCRDRTDPGIPLASAI